MAEDEKKKKKTPGLWETGKALYQAYMRRRKKMGELRPRFGEGGIKKPKPKPPAEAEGEEMEKPIVEQPPKKKKKKEPRGGVGGVLDTIQERKRRMAETLED
jgi:hypothetical protein